MMLASIFSFSPGAPSFRDPCSSVFWINVYLVEWAKLIQAILPILGIAVLAVP